VPKAEQGKRSSVWHLFAFLAVQLNKQLPTAISIHNPTGDRLAFKVRGPLNAFEL
jgi:hypothetical protein